MDSPSSEFILVSQKSDRTGENVEAKSESMQNQDSGQIEISDTDPAYKTNGIKIEKQSSDQEKEDINLQNIPQQNKQDTELFDPFFICVNDIDKGKQYLSEAFLLLRDVYNTSRTLRIRGVGSAMHIAVNVKKELEQYFSQLESSTSINDDGDIIINLKWSGQIIVDQQNYKSPWNFVLENNQQITKVLKKNSSSNLPIDNRIKTIVLKQQVSKDPSQKKLNKADKSHKNNKTKNKIIGQKQQPEEDELSNLYLNNFNLLNDEFIKSSSHNRGSEPIDKDNLFLFQEDEKQCNNEAILPGKRDKYIRLKGNKSLKEQQAQEIYYQKEEIENLEVTLSRGSKSRGGTRKQGSNVDRKEKSGRKDQIQMD